MKKPSPAALNRNLPVPLYYQIAEYLLDQIRARQLLPGEQLPSERELSAQFEVSRMTARQAINYLVNEGVLIVRHGQGTFVAEPKLTYDAPHLLGFTEAMLRAGKVATSSVLKQQRIAAPEGVCDRLELMIDDEVVQIMRVRRMNDIPLVIETIYVPSAICPGLETVDLSSASLYTVFEHDYGLHLNRASQTLAARAATEFESQWLEVVPGVPIITLEGVTYLDSGQAVECFSAHYRADRFTFAFESQRGAFSADAAPFEMVLDQQRLTTMG